MRESPAFAPSPCPLPPPGGEGYKNRSCRSPLPPRRERVGVRAGILGALVTLCIGNARADLIHLNQGGTVSGTILKQDDAEIQVRLTDGSTVHIPRERIYKISPEEPARPQEEFPQAFEDPQKRFTIRFPKGWSLGVPVRDFVETDPDLLVAAIASRTKQNEPVVLVAVDPTTKEDFLAGGLALPMIPLFEKMGALGKGKGTREKLAYSHLKTAIGHVHKVTTHVDGGTAVAVYFAYLDNVTVVRVTCIGPRFREKELSPLFDRIVGTLAMPERELPAQGK